MSNPNQQHIVSKCLLKQFSKDEASVLKDMEALKNESVLQNKNKLAHKSCYRLLSKDFEKFETFKISRDNIVSPDKKIFCEKGLYSIKEKYYREYLFSKGMVDIRNDNEIKYYLERVFGEFENKFGIFIKDWNENKSDLDSFFNKYQQDILEFVMSNECRAKHLYMKNQKNIKIIEKAGYRQFDYLIFSAFITLNFGKIIEKLDLYEIIEVLNYVSGYIDIDYNEKNDLFKKFFVSKNIDLACNKNLILLKNNTKLSFLLSDVVTSVFYSDSDGYKNALKIIGIDKFNLPPKKIILMPLSKDLIAVVSDMPCLVKSLSIDSIFIVRKLNSLLYSNNNEWLVVYDIELRKNEIVDKKLLKILRSKENYSNVTNWFKIAAEKESCSNDEYRYNKITIKSFNYIREFIKYLRSIEDLSKSIKVPSHKTLNFKGDEKYDREGVTFIKCNSIEKHFLISNQSIFKEFFNFSDMQLKCIEKALIIEGYISGIYVSKNRNIMLFYKNISKSSRIIETIESYNGDF